MVEVVSKERKSTIAIKKLHTICEKADKKTLYQLELEHLPSLSLVLELAFSLALPERENEVTPFSKPGS